MNCAAGLTFILLLALELIVYCVLTPHRDLLRDRISFGRPKEQLAHNIATRDPEASNPFSLAWDNSVALCAIARSEATADVREWLQYYRYIGVDHIYLYDNSEDGGAQAVDFADFIADGFLSWLLVSGTSKQVGSYQHCADNYGKSYSWLVTVDIDEYIMVTDQSAIARDQALKEILKDFRFYPGLWLQWRVFGSSGHEHRPASGGALLHYMECVTGGPLNMYGKTIANMFWFRAISNAHASFYKGDGMHVSDVFEPLPQVFDEVTQQFTRSSSRMPPRLELNRVPFRGSRAVLHHYATKSLEDFTAKLLRGTADKSSGISIRHREWFDIIQRRAVAAPRCMLGVHVGQACCYRFGEPWPPLPAVSTAPPITLEAQGVQGSKEQSDEVPKHFWQSHVHPFSADWVPSVALCARVHPDTALSSLLVWMHHHRTMGVSNFTLVLVHDDVTEASEWDAMRKLARQLPAGSADVIELRVDRAHQAAAALNQQCEQRAVNQTSWLAVLEIEDFIVLRDLKGNKPLATFLRGTRFRYRPGVVAPVYHFDLACLDDGSCSSEEDDERPSSSMKEALRWFSTCRVNSTEMRTIGNMYWLDRDQNTSSPRFRGDLLPVTSAGKVHIPSGQGWFSNLTQPVDWHNPPAHLRRYLAPSSLGTRLAIFSFPRVTKSLAAIDITAARTISLGICAEARLVTTDDLRRQDSVHTELTY